MLDNMNAKHKLLSMFFKNAGLEPNRVYIFQTIYLLTEKSTFTRLKEEGGQ